MDLIIRVAEANDAGPIAEFNRRLARETEAQELDADRVRRGVERGLARCPEVRYFVAEKLGRVVGQLMLTREWSDWRDGWILWIQSVYVDARYRRQGILRRLLEDSLAATAGADTVGVRLYVERGNSVALETYRQLGFRESDYRLMELVPVPPREDSAAGADA